VSGGAARAAPPFFSNALFPVADIQAKAFGDEQNLTDDEVKEAVQQNPELSADAQEHPLDYAGRQSAHRHRAQSLNATRMQRLENW
jgi:hypothetical protein